MKSNASSAFQKIFVFVALIVFVASLIIAYMNTAEVEGLFFSSNGYVDDKYYQEVSPDGVAFAIVWPIIYVWNTVAIAYIAVSVFLPARKSPVNTNPTLVPITFLICHSVGFGSTIGWLFAFDREILELSLAMLILSVVSLYFAVGISYKRVHDNLEYLDTRENRKMLWLVRILVQNGLCLPATWLTIATLLNTTDVILYKDSFGIEPAQLRGSLTVEDGSTIILCLLFAVIISWFLLDNFVFEKYTRYTFTVFPVFILGLSGLVAKLQNGGSTTNLILACLILEFSVLALIFRVALFVYRLKKRQATLPLLKSEIHNDQEAVAKL